MNVKEKITGNTFLLFIGVLLVLNGIGNIIDDARILTYDLTSILAGLGFVVISRKKNR